MGKTDKELLESLLIGYLSLPCIEMAGVHYRRITQKHKQNQKGEREKKSQRSFRKEEEDQSNLTIGAMVLMGFGFVGTFAMSRFAK